MNKLVQLELSKIKPDPNQPRKVFLSIEALAESIKNDGLINPIEVDEDYVILTGERRFRAVTLLGWETVAVIINSTKMSPYVRLRHQLVENTQQSGGHGDGKGMNILDIAETYARLYELKTGAKYKDFDRRATHDVATYGVLAEIAREVGVAPSTVSDHLKLLTEPDFVKDDLLAGRGIAHYREVRGLSPEQTKQIKIKIAAGLYNNKEEVRAEVQLLKSFPEVGQVLVASQKQNKQSALVLGCIARLGLALGRIPALNDINSTDQTIIRNQIIWIKDLLDQYLAGRGKQ